MTTTPDHEGLSETMTGAGETPVPPADTAVHPRPAADRDRRLLEGLSQLRTRTAALVDGERLLFILGAVFVPLGFLFIVLAWLGASDTGAVFEQIPYVLSGGFTGLGLVVSGGFLYLAWWLTRQTREAREHHAAASAERQAMTELHRAMLTELTAMRAELQKTNAAQRSARAPKSQNSQRSPR